MSSCFSLRRLLRKRPLASQRDDESSDENVFVPEPLDASLGLHIVYEPSGTASVDIVAVHGLGEDAFETWTDQRYGTFWLRDLLPKQLPKARVMTFGYNPGVRAGIGDNRCSWIAEDLLGALEDVRYGENKRRPLVFIAHNLGGIIVERALIISKERETDETFRSLLHVLFFGVPYLGNDNEAAAFSKRLSTYYDVSRPSSFYTQLKAWSPQWVTSSEEFAKLGQFSFTSYWEQQSTKNVVVIGESLARFGVPGERVIGFSADHNNLCKFEGKDDHRYRAVVRRLNAVIEDSKCAKPTCEGGNPAELLGSGIEPAKATSNPAESIPRESNENDTASQIASKHTRLHEAASHGDVELIKVLIAGGANVDALNDNAESPLYLACQKGRTTAVKSLLQLGAKTYTKGMPLQAAEIAIRDGREHCLDILLDHGADVNMVTENGPLLIYAISRNRLRSVQRLLLRGPDVNYVSKDMGRTILHTAAIYATYQVISFLLSKDLGIDIDAIDNIGRTALHYAAECRDLSEFELFYNHGASISLRVISKYQWTILAIAIEYADDNLIEYILEKSPDQLFDRIGSFKRTPLQHAVRNGWYYTCERLLAADISGESLQCTDKRNNTALGIAASRGYKNLVSLLMEKGAIPVVEDIRDLVSEGKDEMLDLLLEKGDIASDFNSEDVTPLLRAIQFGRPSTIFTVLKHVTTVNEASPGWLDRLPLHEAVLYRDYFSIEMLLKAGALTEEKDLFGLKPIDYAPQDKIIAELLKNSEATPPDTLKAIFRSNVAECAENILEDEEKPLSAGYFRVLAAIFCHLKDYKMAAIALEQLIRLSKEKDATSEVCVSSKNDDDCCRGSAPYSRLVHKDSTCHVCKKDGDIVGELYWCKTCAEIEICSACHDNLTHRNRGCPFCESDNFLEIPSNDWQGIDGNIRCSIDGDEKSWTQDEWIKWIWETYKEYLVCDEDEGGGEEGIKEVDGEGQTQ